MAGAYPLRAATAGVLLFVIGLGIGAGTLQVNRQERDRFDGWLQAEGTVTELLKRGTAAGQVQTPLVSFTTAADERIRFTPSADRRHPQYSVASTVAVLYPPDHPQDAIVDLRGDRWTRNALVAGASLILMALGGYVAWYASRWDGTRDGPPA